MKCSTQAAVAIGVGYLLGRRRKLRAATVIAVATAVGGTTVGSMVMSRGMKLLASSNALDKMPPQVADLVDVIRGDLVDAGKAAATAAVTSRIDSLTDSLHDRAEQIRNPADAAGEAADTATGAARETGEGAARETGEGAARAARGATGGATRRRRGRDSDNEPADAKDEDSYPEASDAADDAYDRDEAGADEADDDRDEADDEEPDERPVPRQRTGGRRRPAVYRTRR
jgi:hypothetical protein